MHSAQRSSRAYALAEGGPEGGRFTGSRLLHAVRAASNAGDDELIPGMLLRLKPPPAVGSGKFGTPWERMQRAKLSPSSRAWVWLVLEAVVPAEVELRGEPEPHAAIPVLASITAAADASRGATRDMAHVVTGHRLHLGNSVAAFGRFDVRSGREASRWFPHGEIV